MMAFWGSRYLSFMSQVLILIKETVESKQLVTLNNKNHSTLWGSLSEVSHVTPRTAAHGEEFHLRFAEFYSEEFEVPRLRGLTEGTS